MLSLFPELLAFDLVGVSLLRITVGFLFLSFGWKLMGARPAPPAEGTDQEEGGSTTTPTPPRTLGVLDILIGVLLTVGLYTQGAAIAGVVLALAHASFARTHQALLRDPLLWHLIALICLALLVLGPGLLAFDLPL
ncbi:hypothetical protein GVX82_03215 [Patescibacteria group bacterium]|jgi:uncharacterized membrane protein YphA (DoxX/SURF4 family)|nr:hypothetical protein [Patescibacteria group bacterium]